MGIFAPNLFFPLVMPKQKYSSTSLFLNTDVGFLILRISVGILMIAGHGLPKMQLLFSDNASQFADPFGIGPVISLVLALIAEIICSLLLIIGWKTRWATIPLIITMFVAHFIIHAEDAFRVKELSLVYLFIFLVLLFTGSGRYSLDHFLRSKTQK